MSVELRLVDRIDPMPEVARDSYKPEAYRRLKADLKKNGMINPIHVIKERGTRDRYEAFAGHNRLRAWKELGNSSIPVTIHNIDRNEAIVLGLRENDLREPLTAFDWSKTINILHKEKSMMFKDIAEKLDKDESTIKRLSAISDLPLEVKNRVVEGAIPWSNAYYLLELPKEDDMVEACEYIIKNNLKQRHIIDLVKTIRETGDFPEETESLLINARGKPQPKGLPTRCILCGSLEPYPNTRSHQICMTCLRKLGKGNESVMRIIDMSLTLIEQELEDLGEELGVRLTFEELSEAGNRGRTRSSSVIRVTETEPKAKPDTTWAKGLTPDIKELVIKYATEKNVSLKEARDFFESEN